MQKKSLILLYLLAILIGLLTFYPGSICAGNIQGKVQIEKKSSRRVGGRYPGKSRTMSRPLGAIPTVVFIKGKIPGGSLSPLVDHPSIEQNDFMFHPPLLIIPVGTIVAFPNRDHEFHNVFSYSKAKRFDLGRYSHGEIKRVTFDKPGIVKIYCEIHKWMRAAVVIVENPYYAVVSDDGLFLINDLPPGRHMMAIWNIDHGSQEVLVDVPSTGTREIELRLSKGSGPSLKSRAIYVQQIPEHHSTP